MSIQELDKIISTVFGVEGELLDDNMSAHEIPSWDSMAQFRLIVEIEKTFSLVIEYDEIFSMNTLGDIRRIVAHKLSARVTG